MDQVEEIMKTIEELERYLEDECFSFVELTIGKHFAPEGIVIKQDGNKYIWGYSERGNMKIIKSFKTEEELVDYAQNQLENDKWMKGHLVAWTLVLCQDLVQNKMRGSAS